MKKLILLLAVFSVVFLSCHKERVLSWPGNVDELMEGLTYGESPQAAFIEAVIAGELALKPDPAYGYCLLPDRADIPIFSRWLMEGELAPFGRLDSQKSYQEHEKCTLVPEADMITAMVIGTLYNENGDAVFYYGDVVCYEDGQYDGKYCISGGTGLFAEATGWISLELVLSKESRAWRADVQGEILVPRG